MHLSQSIHFSSPELKAQVSYSDRRLSVVRLSVNFYILPSSPELFGQYLFFNYLMNVTIQFHSVLYYIFILGFDEFAWNYDVDRLLKFTLSLSASNNGNCLITCTFYPLPQDGFCNDICIFILTLLRISHMLQFI
jgi:hypothetical protein